MIDFSDTMNIYYLVVFFLLGISVGSFLNVIIYRVPKQISFTKGFSHCPACNNRLKPFDLIPLLSYLVLNRKCRYCGVRISPRYFFVELLTGIVYCSIFLKFGLSAEFFAFSFFMSVLIAVFFIDYDEMIIPDGLVITGLIGGGVLYIYSTIYQFNFFGDVSWWNPILGMILGPVVILSMLIVGSLIYNAEAMGGGDVKLFAPIGLFLGWKMTIMSLFLSIVAGGILGGLLILFKIKDRKSVMPFGPFIVVGTYVTIMAGQEIFNWYFRGLQ
jgi:leader peptidase (prepilin peptidase)/N-methyltransferase